MNWLAELLHSGSSTGSLLVLALVAATGLALGSVRVCGLRPGIAGVLFTGLVAGHFRPARGAGDLDFARDLGLVMFVYCVGVQVGPGFLTSLRRSGLPLNVLAAGLVLSGAVLAVLIGSCMHVPMPVAVGLFAGGTTNTPSLGAAQVALSELPWYTKAMGALPGLGYAVAYPFGVLGVIFSMLVTRALFRSPWAELGVTQAPEATRDFDAAEPSGSELTSVQVLSMFIGIGLGLLLGSLPFPHPRPPGPLAPRPRGRADDRGDGAQQLPPPGPLTWRMPEKANLTVREIGIVLFLSSVGIHAGRPVCRDARARRWLSLDGERGRHHPAAGAVPDAPRARYALKLRYHLACGVLAGA